MGLDSMWDARVYRCQYVEGRWMLGGDWRDCVCSLGAKTDMSSYAGFLVCVLVRIVAHFAVVRLVDRHIRMRGAWWRSDASVARTHMV